MVCNCFSHVQWLRKIQHLYTVLIFHHDIPSTYTKIELLISIFDCQYHQRITYRYIYKVLSNTRYYSYPMQSQLFITNHFLCDALIPSRQREIFCIHKQYYVITFQEVTFFHITSSVVEFQLPQLRTKFFCAVRNRLVNFFFIPIFVRVMT